MTSSEHNTHGFLWTQHSWLPLNTTLRSDFPLNTTLMTSSEHVTQEWLSSEHNTHDFLWTRHSGVTFLWTRHLWLPLNTTLRRDFPLNTTLSSDFLWTQHSGVTSSEHGLSLSKTMRMDLLFNITMKRYFPLIITRRLKHDIQEWLPLLIKKSDWPLNRPVRRDFLCTYTTKGVTDSPVPTEQTNENK